MVLRAKLAAFFMFTEEEEVSGGGLKPYIWVRSTRATGLSNPNPAVVVTGGVELVLVELAVLVVGGGRGGEGSAGELRVTRGSAEDEGGA